MSRNLITGLIIVAGLISTVAGRLSGLWLSHDDWSYYGTILEELFVLCMAAGLYRLGKSTSLRLLVEMLIVLAWVNLFNAVVSVPYEYHLWQYMIAALLTLTFAKYFWQERRAKRNERKELK